jgi:hypothetical protein
MEKSVEKGVGLLTPVVAAAALAYGIFGDTVVWTTVHGPRGALVVSTTRWDQGLSRADVRYLVIVLALTLAIAAMAYVDVGEQKRWLLAGLCIATIGLWITMIADMGSISTGPVAGEVTNAGSELGMYLVPAAFAAATTTVAAVLARAHAGKELSPRPM